jgi:glycosyltransferase involved in cell wall biosynthesis
MFAAKPIVASDVGAIREALSDGETGVLVPREDSAALCQAISALAAAPARRTALGEAARARALAEFTLDPQVAAFNRILWQECSVMRGLLAAEDSAQRAWSTTQG